MPLSGGQLDPLDSRRDTSAAVILEMPTTSATVLDTLTDAAGISHGLGEDARDSASQVIGGVASGSLDS